MSEIDRIGDRLRTGDRLLVVYLTLGDPLTDLDVALAAVDAGADVLEVGIPTPGTRPRGADIAASFDRAGHGDQPWALVRELRIRLPRLPLLALVYPATATDLGADRLLGQGVEAGLDGLVLTAPDGPLTAAQVAATELSAIPLVTPATEPAHRRRLEDTARHLTYQALADRTGVRLDPARVGGLARTAATSATKPFLGGFGIRDEHDIRAVAPHAAGVVIGSELLRDLAATRPAARTARTETLVRRWKAALSEPNPIGSSRAC